MADLKDIVRETGKLLAEHELGPELDQLWRTIQWQEEPNESGDGVALTPATQPIIRLYPNLAKNSHAGKAVLREFGQFLLRRGGERAESIWGAKLCVPLASHIAEFEAKLEDQQLRKTYKTYEEVMQTYPQKGSSVPRLIAIHLANALIANNVPYSDSIGVNVKTWGPTTEFANLKKYHSLVPLTSAYCSKEVHENFGCAFADLIINDLSSTQDTSVAYALKGIIRNVIKRAQD